MPGVLGVAFDIGDALQGSWSKMYGGILLDPHEFRTLKCAGFEINVPIFGKQHGATQVDVFDMEGGAVER